MSIRKGGEEAGFGLIELVIALAILNVVILALFATFNAGGLALQRSGRISTAETLAGKQMELYRASLFSTIGLENTLLASANGDSTHTSDVAWVSTYLGRLTNAQIDSALRASGASDEEAVQFSAALRERIDQLQVVSRGDLSPRAGPSQD